MSAVIAYLAVDGVVHIWEGSNRGGSPLCGADTFPLGTQPEEPVMAEGCEGCGDAYERGVLGGR